ncbi:MAG: hypothetical protein ABFC77_00055 [Thermoguttaceae bacterium]
MLTSIFQQLSDGILGNSSLAEFYAKNLRGSLFSGFLTLAAFLLSANTFIVIHLQKELYGTSLYHKKIKELRQAKPSLPFYGPLRRLSRLLFWTILFSLMTAIAQLTIGLYEDVWAPCVCIALAFIAVVFLSISFFAMSSALSDWFKQLENDAENEHQDHST